jgi:hypothetical protein
MDIYALSIKLKEEGAAVVQAAMKKLSASMADTTAEAKKTDKAFDGLGSAAKRLAGAIAIGATIKKIVDATAQAQFVQAQLSAALTSTGNAAGQSIESLNAHAEALSRLSVFDDEAIGGAQALLLTFTKIQGDVFPKATQAVLNVAQAMGGDLKGAAIQVGKALNDPIRGTAALSKAGIQFTEDQKAMIQSLVETGQTAQAQAIILKELDTQFAGSAAAARKTLGGALQGLKNDFDNLFEASAGETAPLVTAINGLSTALQPLAGAVGTLIVIIVGGLSSVFASIKNMGLALFRILNRINQFLANVGATVVKVVAMLTGNLTPEFDRSIDNWLKGFDYMDEGLADQQKEWADWETGIYESLAGVRKEAAKPVVVAPPVVGGAGGGGLSAAGRALARGAPLGGPGAGISAFESPSERMARLRREAAAQAAADRARESAEAQPRIAAGFGVDLSKLKAATLPMLDQAKVAALELREQIQNEFALSISTALTTGIIAGIENAIATGNIGEGFMALTTSLLAGLGDAMIQFGQASLVASQLMQRIFDYLASGLPGGAVAASLAMIAAGAVLKGVARAAFGGGGRGGSAASVVSFGAGTRGTAGQTTQLVFGNTSATTAAGMAPRTPMNVTIIGPNDPTAQRAMQELLTKANSRGRIG